MRGFLTVDPSSDLYAHCLDLRRRWLRAPQGLDFSPEDMEDDRAARHVAAVDGDRLLGCVLGIPRAGGIQVRQLVVAADHRRQGIGCGLMAAVEAAFLLESGPAVTFFLNARAGVLPFYIRLGYRPVGAPFSELTIVHQRMEKIISAAPH